MHAPEPGDRGEEDRDRRGEEEGALHRPAEDDVADLGGGEIHRRHDDAVEEETEVDGAESADEGGGLAGVADLVELEVGEDAGAAPHAGVEEDRGHPGEEE